MTTWREIKPGTYQSPTGVFRIAGNPNCDDFTHRFALLQRMGRAYLPIVSFIYLDDAFEFVRRRARYRK